VNILFGYILASILEDNFHRAFNISGGDPLIFLNQPSALALYALSLVTILTQIYPMITGRSLLTHIRSQL
jgi:TctA family transporter